MIAHKHVDRQLSASLRSRKTTPPAVVGQVHRPVLDMTAEDNEVIRQLRAQVRAARNFRPV